MVTGRLVNLDGIINTETMLAFKTFSKHGLEAMFSV